MEHTLVKRYFNHFGIDPKASDLARKEEYASLVRNAQYRRNGSPEKRKGFEAFTESVGGFGLFEYNRIDPLTDSAAPECIAIGQNAHKLETSTFTVAYAGLLQPVLLSVFFDVTSSQYRCQILEDINIVLDFPLGVGFDELSPVTLADLKTAIDAVTNFSAVITGSTTVPAAFLKTVRTFDLVAGPYEGMAGYWSQIYSPITSPFAGSEAHKLDADFENVSAIVISNTLYLSNGYDPVYKYDGHMLTRAGIPIPETLTTVTVPAGSITGTNYVHKAQYSQFDAAGQLTEGNVQSSQVLSVVTGESIDVTVANIQAGSGYNTNCAIVAGAQAVVNTLTVDDGSGGSHTMRVGDTAYFFDAVSAEYVERLVTAVSGTTITVAGAAVTVLDNQVISNNLRIGIYRNESSGTASPTLFYLVEEVPNNAFAATQVVSDDLDDANLGALFIPPATDRSPPPQGKYVSVFQNQMVLSGSLENPRRVFWSDLDGPEYFPNDSNTEEVQTRASDVVTGIAPNGSVFAVLTEQGTHVLSGTLADGNVRLETKSADVGCMAHASIVEKEGVLCWWSQNGPVQMALGQIPTPLGQTQDGAGRLEPVTNNEGKSPEETLRFKRTVGINHIPDNQLLFFTPGETTQSPVRYTNSNSRVWAYDYTRDAWLEWDTYDFSGGVAMHGDDLLWVESRFSEFEDDVTHVVYRRHNLGDAFDYQDNTNPIAFEYGSTWESLSEPSVLKRFMELRVFNLEEIQNNDFTLTVEQEFNFVKDTPVSSFQIDFSGGGYGVTAYGVAPYGDPAEGIVRHELKRAKCRSMRLRFKNSEAQANCVMTGWELLCAAPYRKEFKA